jgi:hypothetical protein
MLQAAVPAAPNSSAAVEVRSGSGGPFNQETTLSHEKEESEYSSDDSLMGQAEDNVSSDGPPAATAAVAQVLDDPVITAATAGNSVTRTARVTHELTCCLTDAVAYARTWNWPDRQRGSVCFAHTRPGVEDFECPAPAHEGFHN